MPTVAPRCPAHGAGGSAERHPARWETASAKGCLENSFPKGLLPSLAYYIFRERVYSEQYCSVLQQRVRFKPAFSPCLRVAQMRDPARRLPAPAERPHCSGRFARRRTGFKATKNVFSFFFNILKTQTLILALQSWFSHNSCDLGLHCLAMLFL